MLLVAYRLLRRRWRLISITALTILVASVLTAFLMTPVYRAEVLVMYASPDQSTSGLSALAGKLAGLPFLGGMGLPDVASGRAEALATLQSRQISEAFIQKHNLLPALFPELWDARAHKWDASPEEVPTLAEGFERFDEDFREITDDKATGLVRVALEGRDREQLSGWANALVSETDQQLRLRALREARSSVTFLENELTKTNVLATQSVIAQLMQTQLGNAAVANSREAYAFRVIDPAVTPEEDDFVRPKRLLIIALGLVLGIFLGFAAALIRDSAEAAP